MSRADTLFIQNCKDIMQNGVWDTHLPVRPRWEDGTPAHTVKKFGIVNRYDSAGRIPHPHHPQDGVQVVHRRDLMDLAEEEQQHPRPQLAYLGQLGG